MVFDLEEELKKLPDRPGVYLMHDASDKIIYVGKAVVLRNRVRQYFQAGSKKSPKIQRMVSRIAWFETIVVDSEAEALVLECNLIKEHRPKYNTMLKDDKGYPYIRVTCAEEYPRVMLARQTARDQSRYYGPYVNVGAVKDTLKLLHRLFRIRDCNRKLPEEIGRGRPCLNYHIHQCDGPCMGYITPEKYREAVDRAEQFLSGRYEILLKDLEKRMQDCAMAMDFEGAAALRDLMFSVQKMDERQKMEETGTENRDVIGLAHGEQDAIAQVFFVREGRLIGRDHFRLKVAEGDSERQILLDFVKQFYAGTPFIPREILLPRELEEADSLSEWLSAKAGHKVTMAVPRKGEKRKILELAGRNAELILNQDRDKVRREEARTLGAVRQLEEILGMSGLSRMEAFDISNISGFDSVGSMVVYENGRPKRSDYRRFRIRWVKGPNDYASMEEVLTRRFRHGLEERDRIREKGMEEEYGSFTNFPDLLLMDGGRGQVNIAEAVLAELGLHIPVCGMVKDDNHRTRGLYFRNEELPIDRSSEAFHLITRIQDEAHRFAIEYHRNLRSRDQVHSVLDDIPGVGNVRRKALMREFQTIDAMQAATLEEIAAIPEMNRNVARTVYAFFHDGEIPE